MKYAYASVCSTILRQEALGQFLGYSPGIVPIFSIVLLLAPHLQQVNVPARSTKHCTNYPNPGSDRPHIPGPLLLRGPLQQHVVKVLEGRMYRKKRR